MLLKFKYFLFIFLMSYASFAQFSNYNVGDTVNDFTVTDTDGQTYTLYDLLSQGKYVYIEFFATNCGTCQSKTPIFNAFYDKYGCNAGDLFCISIEVAGHNNAEVIAFEQQYGGTTHHAPAVSVDGGAANVVSDFGVNTFPVICGIGPDKKLFVENVTPVQNVYDIAQSFPRGFNPPVMDCTANIESTQHSLFKVFPNPIHRFVHITTKNPIIYLSVFNLDGIVIYHQKFDSVKDIQLDLNLTNGIYLLELKSKTIIWYHKIIVIN